jgi:hypothetical protein
MTGQQMINAFDQYYDKITNLSAPGYTEEEKLLFLNNAQDEFVKERTFGKNFQPPAFDINQKRVADIRLLLDIAEVAATSNTNYGGCYTVPLHVFNSDLLFLLKVEAKITRTDPTITSAYVPARQIELKDVDKFAKNSFNRLWFKYPVYFNSQAAYIFVIGDYYTTNISYVKSTFVRKPVTIYATINEYNGTYSANYMSLEPYTHQEIIDKAVRQAMVVSQDARWQGQVAENQIKTE